MHEQPCPRVEDAHTAIPGGGHEAAAPTIDRQGVRGSPFVERPRHPTAGHVEHTDALGRADEDTTSARIDRRRERRGAKGDQVKRGAAAGVEDAECDKCKPSGQAQFLDTSPPSLYCRYI